MTDGLHRDRFLQATAMIDWTSPDVLALARRLAETQTGDVEIARACFNWVRDSIMHTSDHSYDRVTRAASEVLEAGTGFCYGKSHLLAALLRANGIPAGFVYQRLALDETASTFCLHGLNAVWLSAFGWYRLDPRGNRDDLHAEYQPPREVLPFTTLRAGEQLFPFVFFEPLPIVCDALRQHKTRQELEAHLPDAAWLDAVCEGAVHLNR
jgi:hypothetical protein